MSNSSDPMDCSLPGFSVHGISQAKVLEWGVTDGSLGTGKSRHICLQRKKKRIMSNIEIFDVSLKTVSAQFQCVGFSPKQSNTS